MSLNNDHSAAIFLLCIPFCHPISKGLDGYVNISLVHNHELGINSKHHCSILLEDFVSQLEVVILVDQHIKWSEFHIENAACRDGSSQVLFIFFFYLFKRVINISGVS
jgi:hypothetical protein